MLGITGRRDNLILVLPKFFQIQYLLFKMWTILPMPSHCDPVKSTAKACSVSSMMR